MISIANLFNDMAVELVPIVSNSTDVRYLFDSLPRSQALKKVCEGCAIYALGVFVIRLDTAQKSFDNEMIEALCDLAKFYGVNTQELIIQRAIELAGLDALNS